MAWISRMSLGSRQVGSARQPIKDAFRPDLHRRSLAPGNAPEKLSENPRPTQPILVPDDILEVLAVAHERRPARPMGSRERWFTLPVLPPP
jgi:hypothetical protein